MAAGRGAIAHRKDAGSPSEGLPLTRAETVQDAASESIQRESRRLSRVISVGSLSVLLNSAVP